MEQGWSSGGARAEAEAAELGEAEVELRQSSKRSSTGARRGGRGGARPELGGEGWVELGPSGGSGWSRAPSELGVECGRSSGRSAGGSRTDDLRGGGAADRDRAAGGAARPSERRLRVAQRGPL